MGYNKIFIALMLLGGSVRAQTFSEWFSQKKTQKKYLLQQIAALQTYSGYLNKGYRIAKGGLGNIGGFISSEFGSHDRYYKHLKTVNTVVKNNPQVNEILRWQQDILKQVKSIKHQNRLTPLETDYTRRVCNTLLSDCDARMNDLEIILSDNKVEMSDEERIRQVARLHAAMQDNYRFAANFNGHLKLLVSRKQQELNNTLLISSLYARY